MVSQDNITRMRSSRPWWSLENHDVIGCHGIIGSSCWRYISKRATVDCTDHLCCWCSLHRWRLEFSLVILYITTREYYKFQDRLVKATNGDRLALLEGTIWSIFRGVYGFLEETASFLVIKSDQQLQFLPRSRGQRGPVRRSRLSWQPEERKTVWKFKDGIKNAMIVIIDRRNLCFNGILSS